MKTDSLFDFTVNKASQTIEVARAYDADVNTVWQAWTSPDLLKQWWAPKPWTAETKNMDFRAGGEWLYAMVSPEGEKHWSKVSYLLVEKEKAFTAQDGFCDEQGTINPDFPQNVWEHAFSSKGSQTLVHIKIKFDTREDMEKLMEMGFKEGFTMGLNQLDDLLEKLKSENK